MHDDFVLGLPGWVLTDYRVFADVKAGEGLDILHFLIELHNSLMLMYAP